MKCDILDAEPVNSITGEVVVQQNDFVVNGRLPLIWDRYYSGHQYYSGAIGKIWLTPADICVDLVVTDAILGAIAQFPDHKTAFECLPVKEGYEHGELDWQQGHTVYLQKDHLIIRTRKSIEFVFTLPKNWRQKVEQLDENATLSLQCVQMRDLDNHCWQFERSSKGDLQHIIEYSQGKKTGRYIQCSLSQSGHLYDLVLHDEISKESYYLVGYRQNAEHDLIEVLDAQKHPYRFYYTDLHQMTQHTDRNGLSFYYAYQTNEEGLKQVSRAWGDHGLFDYHFHYYPERQETIFTDSLGNTTVLQYDERNYPIARIEPLGGIKTYQYDDQDRGCSEIDPVGNKTEWHYDEKSNLIQTVYPDGSKITVNYDENNRPIEICDAEQKVWQQTWDEKGHLLSQRTPLNQINEYYYDGQGQLIEAKRSGMTTKLSYDRLGFLSQIQHSEQRHTIFSYNSFGDILSKTLSNHDTTYYRYDNKHRLTHCQFPNKTQIICRYDNEDNLIEYIDEAGLKTEFQYFGQGRLKQRKTPDGNTVQYHYDTEEQLVGVTNQRGETWQLKRDAAGRLVEEVDYWGKAIQYTYDAGGNLQLSTDPLGNTLQITCDKMGRIVRKSPLNAPEKAEHYHYNKRGQLTEAMSEACQIKREYDDAGNLLKELQQQREAEALLTYEYNRQGELSRQLHQLRHQHQKAEEAFFQTIQYDYDELGQLISQQIDKHDPILFGYDEIGRLKYQKLGQSLVNEFNYNSHHQLTRQRLYGEKGLVDNIDYYYDQAGNLIKRDDHQLGVEHFSYDLLGQITQHIDPFGAIKTYVYNACGDRYTIVQEDNSARTLAFSQDIYYTLDKAGQLLHRQGNQQNYRLSWDEQGRLSEITKNGERWCYQYDALRRRISKTHYNHLGQPQKSTYFLWDGGVLVGEMTIEHVISGHTPVTIDARFFTYYQNSFTPLVLQRKQQGIGSLAPPVEVGYYFYQTDPNGMPSRLYDETGHLVWLAHYTIFGQIDKTPNQQVTQPLRLQGQYFDEESGLHYNRHRYYDPETGVFISQDPIGLAGGFNPYQFASNTLGWVDPFGLTVHKANADGSYQLFLFPTEAYNRQKHYGSTPTNAQKASVPKGMEFDHDPMLVQHYYEGYDGSLAGFNMTDEERKAFAKDLEHGKAATPAEQRAQGGCAAAYSKKQKKLFGL